MLRTAARRPGRRRSTAADDAILAATLALLREKGYEAMTVAAVIERAGVSSATLYRRWTTKHELVAAALDSVAPPEVDTDTGTLAGDVATFVRHVAQSVAAREDVFSALSVAARDHPDLVQAVRAKLLTPRAEQLDGILERAVARGELARRVPVETALSLVVGPLHHRAFALALPLTPAFLKAATNHALFGLGAVAR